jgi:hypothetical protein
MFLRKMEAAELSSGLSVAGLHANLDGAEPDPLRQHHHEREARERENPTSAALDQPA